MNKPRSKMRRMKLSESVADSLLGRIKNEGMELGDQLPKESQLMEEFGCSKSTLREALKSLENQGIISIKTGPKGGAHLLNVTYDYANKSLRNYFRFKSLNSAEIFEAREPLELALCTSVIGQISEETFDELEAILEECRSFELTPDVTIDTWRTRRKIEIGFNSVIARSCPNLIIGFLCEFINDLISDTIVDNHLYFHSTMKKEYGPKLLRNLERYLLCLKNEDLGGALECVRARMEFIRMILTQVEELRGV